MSVWASMGCHFNVVIYDGGYGEDICEDGFLDVAVSCLSDRVRIIAESEGESGLSLDPEGVSELIRKLILAQEMIARRWGRDGQAQGPGDT